MLSSVNCSLTEHPMLSDLSDKSDAPFYSQIQDKITININQKDVL